MGGKKLYLLLKLIMRVLCFSMIWKYGNLIFPYFHEVQMGWKYRNIRSDISIFLYLQGPWKYGNMEISCLIFPYFQSFSPMKILKYQTWYFLIYSPFAPHGNMEIWKYQTWYFHISIFLTIICTNFFVKNCNLCHFFVANHDYSHDV